MSRLVALSATNMPAAGLTGEALQADQLLECAYLAKHGAFEPYGDFIPWGV
jgi:hypothetical protein